MELMHTPVTSLPVYLPHIIFTTTYHFQMNTDIEDLGYKMSGKFNLILD